MSIDASCIITCHHEGALLASTLHSFSLAKEYAAAQGLAIECILVLDDADEMTIAIAEDYAKEASFTKTLHVCNYDCGLSRNEGISIAAGEIIVICDGDDLLDNSYLVSSILHCKNGSRKSIWYPDTIIMFGGMHAYVEYPRNILECVTLYDFVSQHPLCSVATAHRAVFEHIPYKKPSNGFGYEDWMWSCETLAAGYSHHSAEGAIYFYRRRAQSVSTEYKAAQAVVAPNALFSCLPPLEARDWQPGLWQKVKAYVRRILSEHSNELTLVLIKIAQFGSARLKKHQANKEAIPLTAPPKNQKHSIIIEACSRLACIEPLLQKEILQTLTRLPIFSSDTIGRYFAYMYHGYANVRYDIAVITDFYNSTYVKMLNDYATSEQGIRILVIITKFQKNSDEPFAGLDLLQFSNVASVLSNADKIVLLTRLFLQWKPRVLQVAGSILGEEILDAHGLALGQCSHILPTLSMSSTQDFLSDDESSSYLNQLKAALK